MAGCWMRTEPDSCLLTPVSLLLVNVMANGTENIEAKLAAYIEGELTPSERAEIEQYLAANVPHKQIIDELRLHKSQIGSLPRERAPVEVLDHLQAHLERQSLLEDVEVDAGSMRIHRWPQWGAVAAMLLLTTGLGVLVYSVLPGGLLHNDSVAIAPPQIQDQPELPSLDGKQPDTLRDRRANTRDGMTFDAVAGAGGGAGQDFVDKAAEEMEAKRRAEAAGRTEIAAVEHDNEALLKGANAKAAPLSLNNGSAIVVSTDDPLITQNLLAGYLGQNKYQFEPVRTEVVSSSVTAHSNARPLEKTDDQTNRTAAAADRTEPPVLEQQAIGSVASRVNMMENTTRSGEQYLLVRNVSPQDAQRLSTVINSQRGARQQARVYSNGDLYPELQGQQNQVLANVPQLDLTRNQGQLQNGMAKQVPQVRQGDGIRIAVRNGALVAENAPTTLPHAAEKMEAKDVDNALRTDVLIVVRNDPAFDPVLTMPSPAQHLLTPETAPWTTWGRTPFVPPSFPVDDAKNATPPPGD